MAFGPFSPPQAGPKPEPHLGARIKVIGVGGGGNNAVNRMIDAGMKDVEFISVNTDLQSLQTSKARTTLQLGARISRGLGSGGNPEIGRSAAIEDADDIITALDGADMVFITAGLGGGTGTGAAPIVASLASRMGALTVAVVTRPFAFEGKRRMAQAQRGLEELLAVVDTLIVIPNEKLLSVAHDAGFFDSFEIVDDVLRQAVQGIADIITLPGLINRDFADVRATIAGMGYAVMGTASRSGPARATKAAMAAIASPLLDDAGIDGARGILMHVSGSSSLKLAEVNEAAMIVQRAAHEDANILFGTVLDEALGDKIKITVIAAGFRDPKLPREVNFARSSMPEQVLPQRIAPEPLYEPVPRPFLEPVPEPVPQPAVPQFVQEFVPEPVQQPIGASIREDIKPSQPADYSQSPEPPPQVPAPRPEPPPQAAPLLPPQPSPQALIPEPPRETASAPAPVPAPEKAPEPTPQAATAPMALREIHAAPESLHEPAAANPPLPETPAPSEPTKQPTMPTVVEIEEVTTTFEMTETVSEVDFFDFYEQPIAPDTAPPMLQTEPPLAPAPSPVQLAPPPGTAPVPAPEKPPIVSAQQTAVAAYAAISMPEPEVDEEDEEEEPEEVKSFAFAALLEARRKRLESMDPSPLPSQPLNSLPDPLPTPLPERLAAAPIEDPPAAMRQDAPEPLRKPSSPWLPSSYTTYTESEFDYEADAEAVVDTHSLSQTVSTAAEAPRRIPEPEREPEEAAVAPPSEVLPAARLAPAANGKPLSLWSSRGLAWARSLDFHALDFNDRLGRQADVGPSGEMHKNAADTPASVPSFAGVRDPEEGLAELDELDIPAFLRRDE